MKLKLLLFICFLASYSTYGQSLEFTDKVLDKMVLNVNLDGSGMITKEMLQELQLTHEQFKTVEFVNKKRFQQLLTAEEKFAEDPALLKHTFNEINMNSEKALYSVLTEEQLNQYQKLARGKGILYTSLNQQE